MLYITPAQIRKIIQDWIATDSENEIELSVYIAREIGKQIKNVQEEKTEFPKWGWID